MCQQDLRIHTDRLIIRPIQEGDWPDIQRIWEGVNASPYARFDRPHNTDSTDVQGRIARWAAAGQGPDHFFFAVCLCKTVIGYIAFNRRAIGYEAGYCFDPAYHGKGYASESLSALMRLMQNRGVRKLTAGTAVENMPSVRLLTSLGFVLTGTEPVSFYADEAGRPVFFEGGVFEAVL